MTGLRTVAVLLAGGTGSRIGAQVPKQLIEIAGTPILEHGLASFQASPLVDEIVLVMVPSHLDAAREIVDRGGYDKVTQIIEGSGTRSDSTVAALAALGEEECNVLVHDAARPLVSAAIIEANVIALGTHRAVTTAVASSDTIFRLDDDSDRVADVLPRPLLRRVQTPQSFRLSVLRAAYAVALRDPDFTATDDCTVVLRYTPDVPVIVVPGEERNLKVTTPVDVQLAEVLLAEAGLAGATVER